MDKKKITSIRLACYATHNFDLYITFLNAGISIVRTTQNLHHTKMWFAKM